MKERPILFSAPMVRAILEGRKTQTRRVVKPQPVISPCGQLATWRKRTGAFEYVYQWGADDAVNDRFEREQCPYGAPGNRLWVRETWRPFYTNGAIYLADAGTHRLNASSEAEAKRMWPGWRPSIHMPRRHSRINLEVTGVRAERLQEISEGDAADEGVGALVSPAREGNPDQYRKTYRDLWESINGADSWAANPWVWVVEFRKL